jgi:hypothetical protein
MKPDLVTTTGHYVPSPVANSYRSSEYQLPKKNVSVEKYEPVPESIIYEDKKKAREIKEIKVPHGLDFETQLTARLSTKKSAVYQMKKILSSRSPVSVVHLKDSKDDMVSNLQNTKPQEQSDQVFQTTGQTLHYNQNHIPNSPKGGIQSVFSDEFKSYRTNQNAIFLTKYNAFSADKVDKLPDKFIKEPTEYTKPDGTKANTYQNESTVDPFSFSSRPTVKLSTMSKNPFILTQIEDSNKVSFWASGKKPNHHLQSLKRNFDNFMYKTANKLNTYNLPPGVTPDPHDFSEYFKVDAEANITPMLGYVSQGFMLGRARS